MTFIVRYTKKGKLLEKPEHEMFTKFTSGLSKCHFPCAGLPKDMQSALTLAKMAEVCGSRKHDDSIINAIGVCRPKSNRSGTGQSEIQYLKCQTLRL